MNDLIISRFKIFFSNLTIPLDIIFFSILVILLPCVLITGPALPDIFLSLVAIYFLFKSIKSKKWYYYKNPIVYGFLLFSAYGILRSLFYEAPWQSLSNEGSLFYFRYIFFALGIWYLLDHNPYLSKYLLIVSLISIAIVSFDGFYQYFFSINITGNEKYNEFRLTGFFGDEPIIGRYIAYLSIFSFSLIYQSFQKTKKMLMLSVTFLVFIEIFVFLSGERAPFFYLSLFSVLVLIFIPKYRIYRIVGVLLSAIIIYGILQVNPSAKKRMVDYSIEQISETKIPFLPYSTHHEQHYVSALNMFMNKPLFGVGTNTFRFECEKIEYLYKKSCNSHPHHYYLQILAELGLIGFFALSSFFFYLCFIGLRQLFFMINSDQKKLMPFEFFLYPMILFVYWWPFIPHMSFYNNWTNVFMMLPLGFFMRYMYGYKSHGNN